MANPLPENRKNSCACSRNFPRVAIAGESVFVYRLRSRFGQKLQNPVPPTPTIAAARLIREPLRELP
jgi:hypothetical protein